MSAFSATSVQALRGTWPTWDRTRCVTTTALNDLRLSLVLVSFPIKENISLTFKAQAFAITNTPIFANPNAQQGASAFGQITSLAVSANGVTDGGGYRILQLALKLEF